MFHLLKDETFHFTRSESEKHSLFLKTAQNQFLRGKFISQGHTDIGEGKAANSL